MLRLDLLLCPLLLLIRLSYVVSASGDCQFRALAGALYSDENRHTEVRSRVASWLNTHQKVTLRVSSSPSSTETTQLDFEDFLSKDEYPSWKAYCVSVARPGSWGDHLSLIAAANTFNANIHVISGVAAATDEQATTLIEPQVVETKPASAPPSTIYLTHYPEYHYNYVKKNQKSL